jgi:hypothetical protein
MIPVSNLIATIKDGGTVIVTPVIGMDDCQFYCVVQGKHWGGTPCDVTYPDENPLRKLNQNQRHEVHYSGVRSQENPRLLASRQDKEREIAAYEG